MANLTTQLDDNLVGTPIRDPGSSGNSGLASALGLVAKGINAFGDMSRQNAQQKRQAAADALAADSRSAIKDTTEGVLNLDTNYQKPAYGPTVTPDPTISGAAEDVFGDNSTAASSVTDAKIDAAKAAGRLTNVMAAVEQGKMPAISQDAAYKQTIQMLINKHPENVDAILDTLKKNGVPDSVLSRSIQDENKKLDAERDNQQQVEDQAYTAGAASFDAQTLSTMSRADIIKSGLDAIHSANVLNIATQKANLVEQDKAATRIDKQDAESDKNKQILTNVTVDSANTGGPIMASIGRTVSDILKLPEAEQEGAFQKLGPQYDALASSYKAQYVAHAVANGYTGDQNALGQAVDTQIARMRTMWSGDFSVAKANLNAFQATATRLRIDGAKAMPVYFALQQLGMRPDTIPGVMDGVASDPKLVDSLRNEVLGFSNDFGQPKASTHLANIVSILKQHTTLPEYTPEQARAIIPTLYHTTKAITTEYVRGKNNDPDAVIGGLGSLISASRTITSSSGLASWTTATAGLATATTRNAIDKLASDPQHKEMATAVAVGARAASANILLSQHANMSAFDENFYKTQWDSRNGRYIAVFDQKGFDKARAPTTGAFVPGSFSAIKLNSNAPKPTIPSKMLQFIDTANANLTNVISLGKYDTNTPKGSELELRNWYGNGVPPKSLQGGGNSIDPHALVDRDLQGLQDTFEKVATSFTPIAGDVASIVAGPEGTGDNPRSSADGPGQFLDGTFRDQMSKAHPEVKLPSSNAELGPFKKQYGHDLINSYAQENAPKLATAGVPVTTQNLALAHFAGPQGAIALLKANPNTPAIDVLGAGVIKANPQLRGKTVAEALNWSAHFYRG